jgi:hypothetical protein
VVDKARVPARRRKRPVARWVRTVTRGLRTHPANLPRRRFRLCEAGVCRFGANGIEVCCAHLGTGRARLLMPLVAPKR